MRLDDGEPLQAMAVPRSMTPSSRPPSTAAGRVAWLAPLVLCLLLLAGLNARRLDRVGYWEDEIYTARDIGLDRISDRDASFRFSFSKLTYRNDNHPPLYFYLIAEWTSRFGFSEDASRSFSLVFFVASLLVCGLAMKEWVPDWSWGPFWTALLVGLSPAFSETAREARMYSLVLFWTSLSMFFFCRAWRNWKGGRTPSWWVLLGLAASNTLGLYTHYYFAWLWLSESALALLAAVRAPRGHFSSTSSPRGHFSSTSGLILALMATPILFAPWLPLFQHQYEIKFQPGLWVLGDKAWGRYLGEMAAAVGKLASRPLAIGAGWPKFFAAGALLALLARVRSPGTSRVGIVAAIGGLAGLFALINDLFHHTVTLGTSRYMLACLLPLSLALIGWLGSGGRALRALGLVSLLLAYGAVWRHQSSWNQHPDWRMIASRIEARPTSAIVVSNSNYRRCLRFYLPSNRRVAIDGESSRLPADFDYLTLYLQWNQEDRSRLEELQSRFQVLESVKLGPYADLFHFRTPGPRVDQKEARD